MKNLLRTLIVLMLIGFVFPLAAIASDTQSTNIQHSEKIQNESNPGLEKNIKGHSRIPFYLYIVGTGIFLLAITIFSLAGKRGEKFLGNIKIRTSLYLLSGLILLLTVFVGAYGITNMKKIGNEIVEITEQDIPLTQIITSIETHQLEQAIWFERAIRFSFTNHHDEYMHAQKEFNRFAAMVDKEIKKGEKLAEKAIEAAKTIDHKTEFKQTLNLLLTIEKEHSDFDSHVEKVFELINHDQIDKINVLVGKIEKEEEELDHKLEQFLVHIERFTANSTKTAVLHEKEAIKGITAILVLSIIASLIITFFITRGIVNPIFLAVSFADTVANGDLTQTLNIDQKDEIGSLAKSLNSMSKKLQGMFQDITQGTQTLTSSATELSAVSEQISINSEQTAEKSNSVAAAAEEMATNMNSVAAATEQTTANIQTIVSASEEMTATINEIASNTAKGSETTSQAVKKAQEVSKKVDKLGKAASEISKFTETIADISAQTNLLALNATIEAARAGEAGKGFAVVAQEIKSLALQTDEATREISGKISGVQTTTTESVTAIESIVAVINEINDIVTTVATAIEEQSATTQEISNNVSQIATGVQEVNENVNQTSAVAGEVTQDIAGVSQVSEEMKTGSQQVNISAVELSKLAEDLNEMVSQFKI